MYIAFQGHRYFLLYNSSFQNNVWSLQKVNNGGDIASHREAVRKGGRMRCTLQRRII